MTIALVVPCKNEYRRLDPSAFLDAIRAFPWLTFLFVDDGSTDETAETLAFLERQSPAVQALYLPRNVGKAEAVRAGVQALLAQTATDWIGFWDADLATPLAELAAFRAAGVRTPIIVLSARGSVEAKVTGLEAGGDDYLAKPFSITELVARVQALLRRASATPEATALREADLEVDVVTHRVTRAGRRIDLQPLEYQLLEYLMRNKGRVVSKTTIMERVWDYAFDPHTNVVEVRVSRLRSKITAPGERELIHTIRRFGYVLEAR